MQWLALLYIRRLLMQAYKPVHLILPSAQFLGHTEIGLTWLLQDALLHCEPRLVLYRRKHG